MAGTWVHRIEQAEARGEFTKDDKLKATQWTHCACGEQTLGPEHMLLFASGPPIDRRLEMLGQVFPIMVKADNFAGAREVLRRIERNTRRVTAAGESKEWPACTCLVAEVSRIVDCQCRYSSWRDHFWCANSAATRMTRVGPTRMRMSSPEFVLTKQDDNHVLVEVL